LKEWYLSVIFNFLLSLQAKRLVMYLAKKHNYTWVNKINLEKANFGIEKRFLCKNAKENILHLLRNL